MIGRFWIIFSYILGFSLCFVDFRGVEWEWLLIKRVEVDVIVVVILLMYRFCVGVKDMLSK